MAGGTGAWSSPLGAPAASPLQIPDPWDTSPSASSSPEGCGLESWALSASEAELTEELEQFLWSLTEPGDDPDVDRGGEGDVGGGGCAGWPPEALLDATVPGPVLAELLAAVDLPGCADGQLVAAVAAAGRLQAWAAWCQLAAVSALVRRVTSWRGVASARVCASRSDAVTPELMAASEVGPACDLSPGQARSLVDLAVDLRRLPVTRAALAAGDLDLATARMTVDTLAVLDDQTAARVEARVLAGARGRTKAQLGASLRRAVIAADPAAAEARHASRCRPATYGCTTCRTGSPSWSTGTPRTGCTGWTGG